MCSLIINLEFYSLFSLGENFFSEQLLIGRIISCTVDVVAIVVHEMNTYTRNLGIRNLLHDCNKMFSYIGFEPGL